MRPYRANGLLKFDDAWREMKRDILNQPLFGSGEWQSQKTEVRTRELMGVVLEYLLPVDRDTLANETLCNLPWAEDHFQERVSGQPLNPPPSEQWWPFNQNGNAAHKADEKFSHTYPERFWPKRANAFPTDDNPEGVNWGIRYKLGDLSDVVALLRRSPASRQAYLPVWFPEDTGTVHGGRVPCSLGYHFLIRGGQLHCWYSMRSCDLLRHFPDDVYMAGRLVQWVCDQLNDPGGLDPEQALLYPGVLTMTISSLHVFETDDYMLTQQASYHSLSGRRR